MGLQRRLTWFLRYSGVLAGPGDIWRFRRINHAARLPEAQQTASPVAEFRVRGLVSPVLLRPGTTDPQVFIDTFIARYHRPIKPLGPTPRILDLGCYTGLTCLDFLRVYPGAKVVGVELEPANAALARQHASLHAGRFQVIEAAVWHSGGTVNFNRGDAWAHAVAPAGLQTARAVTIDQLLDQLQWDRVNFLKMDIEGSEAELFNRPADWLARVDQLKVELHPPADRVAVRAVLTAAGFYCTPTADHPAALAAWR